METQLYTQLRHEFKNWIMKVYLNCHLFLTLPEKISDGQPL